MLCRPPPTVYSITHWTTISLKSNKVYHPCTCPCALNCMLEICSICNVILPVICLLCFTAVSLSDCRVSVSWKSLIFRSQLMHTLPQRYLVRLRIVSVTILNNPNQSAVVENIKQSGFWCQGLASVFRNYLNWWNISSDLQSIRATTRSNLPTCAVCLYLVAAAEQLSDLAAPLHVPSSPDPADHAIRCCVWSPYLGCHVHL